MKSSLFRLFGACCAIVLSCLAGAAAADTHAGSPLSLIVTYHTSVAHRAALRQELAGPGLRQFQRWREQGILQDYQLLYGRYADSGNLDAVALLTFAGAAGLQQWTEIERTMPGGLTPAAQALVESVHSAPADLERSKRQGGTSAQSVFMVIPYETMISAPEYLKYADGYVIPQMDGWMREGVLAHYGLYVNRYAAGRPFSTMLVLEYKDEAALGRREAVVAKVRAALKDNPEWKAISDAKKNIRNEKQLVVADPLVAR
jgi:hypothetical protein